MTVRHTSSGATTRIVLISRGLDGHRREYVDLFSAVFRGAGWGIRVVRRVRHSLCSRAPVLFLMIEEHTLRFVLTSALRSLSGRRTAGLLFRSSECARPRGLRLLLKHLTLRALRRFPHVTIISILPLQLDRATRFVVNEWIYDPQLWDLRYLPDRHPEPWLCRTVEAAAGMRSIIVALGAQTREKGFCRLAELWTSSNSMRDEFLLVIGGAVSPDATAMADRIRDLGGIVIDRHLTDSELYTLYEAADLVWACYAPEYDQASGILGRAIQRGKPAIVRRGSKVAELAKTLGHPTISIDWNDHRPDITRALALEISQRFGGRPVIDDLARQSLEKIFSALACDVRTRNAIE